MWPRHPHATLVLVLTTLLAFILAISGCSDQKNTARGRKATDSEKPQITVNYWPQVNEHALAIPEDERAWPLIRDALILHTEQGSIPEWLIASSKPSLLSLSPEQLEHIRSQPAPEEPAPAEYTHLDTMDAAHFVHWLDAHREFISALREASQLSGLGYIISDIEDPVLARARADRLGVDFSPAQPADNPDLVGGLMPHLWILRRASAVLLGDAELAVAEGKPDQTTQNILAVERLAVFVQENPFLLSQRMSFSMQQRCIETVARILHEYPDVAAKLDLSAISQALHDTFVGMDLARALDADLWMYEDVAQRVFSNDGQGDGIVTNAGLDFLHSLMVSAFDMTMETPDQDKAWKQWLDTYTRNGRFATRSQDRALYMIYYNAWRDDFAVPPWQRASKNPSDDLIAENILPSEYRPKNIPFAICSTIIRPAPNSVSRKQRQLWCETAATRAAIAAFEHRIANGDWPATLAEIDTTYSPEPFIDAYTGKALLYKLTEEGPLIYSAGTDRDDDEGRPYKGALSYPPWQTVEEISNLDTRELEDLDGDWVLYPPSPKPKRQPADTLTRDL
jgi:hypothetical protein